MAKAAKLKAVKDAAIKEESTKKREFKLDMFKAVLPAADKCNLQFYTNLNNDEKKSFAPLVVMRYMSAVTSQVLAEHYIIGVNELVNIGFWELVKHPELQWKLIASAGIGANQRHEWIPMTKKTSSTAKLDNLILTIHPFINDMELDLVKAKLTKESVKQLCRDFALDDSEIRSVVTEYEKHIA